MPRSRARKSEPLTESPAAVTEPITAEPTAAFASPAEEAAFNAAFNPPPVIQSDQVVHGESVRQPEERHAQAEHREPEPVHENGHASAVERKPLPRPADPFGIATDVLAGIRLSESRRYGKMLLAFEEKPSPEVIAKLRDANFRYEPMEKVWALGLGDRPLSSRITAEETFNEVSKMTREERGIKHSVGVAAS